MPLSSFALKELTERVDMGSAEGRAKFLQDAKLLVKRISAPMLGLMLRKRVAELAGVTAPELDQRFGPALTKNAQRAPAKAARSSSDPWAKLLERLLAQPSLLKQVWSVPLPEPAAPSAEAKALIDLVEQSRSLSGELTVASAFELLRARGHDATLQRLLPAVHDLEGLSAEELTVEVAGAIEGLAAKAKEADIARVLAQVSSPADLSPEAREMLAQAPARGKLVQSG
jgi:DNA primase